MGGKEGVGVRKGDGASKEREGMKQGGERGRLVLDWEKQKVATLHLV